MTDEIKCNFKQTVTEVEGLPSSKYDMCQLKPNNGDCDGTECILQAHLKLDEILGNVAKSLVQIIQTEESVRGMEKLNLSETLKKPKRIKK